MKVSWKDAQENECAWTKSAWETGELTIERRRKDLFWRLGYFGIPPEELEDKVVADIGCGPLSMFSFLRVKQLIAVDPLVNKFEKFMAIKFPQGHITGRGEELPIPDESTDHVFAINLLAHVDDPARVVEEMKRILKRGGILALHSNLNEHLDTMHLHSFTAEELDSMMSGLVKLRDKVVFDVIEQYYSVWRKV